MDSFVAPIIHIGFGKTGTTSLQRYFFPGLCRDMGYIYNPKEWLCLENKESIHSDKDSFGSAEISRLREVISNYKVLISDESLINWNPHNWEISANSLLEIFGPFAKIVISIREPLDYLCSLYLQKLQEGQILRAEEFFVSSEEFEKLAERGFLRFDYEKFDYACLASIYEKRFKNVYFMPFSRLHSLYPFDELFSLSESEIKKYSKAFRKSPRENISYSEIAVRLTFLKQKLLNLLVTRASGFEHICHEKDVISKPQNSLELNSSLNFEELSQKDESRVFFRGLFRKIVKPWRWYMQRIVDRFYPYKKYNLPKEVLAKFQNSLMEKNKQFSDEL